jgi:hypothetical protein
MVIEISAIISVGNVNMVILIDHDPALRNNVVLA